jgi:hypothetical protein
VDRVRAGYPVDFQVQTLPQPAFLSWFPFYAL